MIDKNLIVSSSINIAATPEKVWDVLTQPEKIKVYLFGTEVHTDWALGSSILFQGAYNGQAYKDKGKVLELKKNAMLQYTYWSGFSGLEDKPENYSIVTYSITVLNEESVAFTWHQQGFSSEEGKCHTEEGLKAMLETIKELAEQ